MFSSQAKTKNIFLSDILDSLEDTHLWELAQRITSEKELLDLGLNVLHLPEYKIKSSLHNKKDIELAAHEALSTWRKDQISSEEAYKNLHTALCDQGWRQLAGELKSWVEGIDQEIVGKAQVLWPFNESLIFPSPSEIIHILGIDLNSHM